MATYTTLWNDHALHIQEMYRYLFDSNDFADITLVSDDLHTFEVHKFILSSCSTVFKDILKIDPMNTIIFLNGIKYEELNAMLQIMYLGEAFFLKERMEDFKDVIKFFNVRTFEGKDDIQMNEKSDFVGKKGTHFRIERKNENLTMSDQKIITAIKQALTNEVQNDQDLVSENVVPTENKQLRIKNTNIKDNNKEPLISYNGEFRNGESLPIEDTTTSTKNDPRVTVNNDAEFKCKLCHYEAPSNSDLNTHINFIHNEYVDYKCDRCDYKAARPSNLQHHIQVIHGMKHHCKHCKYETPTISELNSHVNFSHETKNAKVSGRKSSVT